MIIPHSPQIEAAVIGQLLLEPALAKIAKEDFFHGPAYKRIFRASVALSQKGIAPDLATLSDYLELQDLQTANECLTEIVTTANYKGHIDLLREQAGKRRIQKLFQQTAPGLNNPGVPLSDLLLTLRQGIKEIIVSRGIEPITAGQLAGDTWKAIEARATKGDRLSGVTCGLAGLNKHLDGYQESELYILAARPGVGKTASALHDALAASQAGFPVGFMSLEMGAFQLGIRLQSSLSGIPMWRLQKGRGIDWERLNRASETLRQLPLYFLYNARNLNDIVAAAIELVENKGVRILFVDYLQLIRAEGAQNREREISKISGEMKSLAVSLSVPIVCLSQLSRAPEKRDDKRPGLADLRDSGSIEQDADVVILLYRPDITDSKGPVDFIIAKGRNCGCATFKGYFDGETQRFYECAEGLEP